MKTTMAACCLTIALVLAASPPASASQFISLAAVDSPTIPAASLVSLIWDGTILDTTAGSWDPAAPEDIVIPTGCQFARLGFTVAFTTADPTAKQTVGQVRVFFRVNGSGTNFGLPSSWAVAQMPFTASSVGSWTQVVPGSVYRLEVLHTIPSGIRVRQGTETSTFLECRDLLGPTPPVRTKR